MAFFAVTAEVDGELVAFRFIVSHFLNHFGYPPWRFKEVRLRYHYVGRSGYSNATSHFGRSVVRGGQPNVPVADFTGLYPQRPADEQKIVKRGTLAVFEVGNHVNGQTRHIGNILLRISL